MNTISCPDCENGVVLQGRQLDVDDFEGPSPCDTCGGTGKARCDSVITGLVFDVRASLSRRHCTRLASVEAGGVFWCANCAAESVVDAGDAGEAA